MARRRFQNPKPHRHGNQWRVLVWKDVWKNGKWTRERAPQTLGAVDEITFREAQKRAAKAVEPLNQQPRNPGVAITFGEFVEQVYRPTVLPLLARSHAERYAGVLKNYLLPAFGKVALFDIEKPSSTLGQQFFISLRDRDLSRESLDKIRDCFSSVLRAALEKTYIANNPALTIKLPKARATPRLKPTVTVEQFNALVAIVPEPYATMMYVAVWTGLRVSELVALRWRDIGTSTITVDEKCCRGEWGEPKSEASKATIQVLPKVIHRIHALKNQTVRLKGGRGGYQTFKLVKSSGPNDLVFQSVRKGAVMRDNNILSRFIAPAARTLALAGVNWQCLRRSHATWLKRAGVPLKDASVQMRHARTSITADIYEMTPEADQVTAVSKLESLGSTMVN